MTMSAHRPATIATTAPHLSQRVQTGLVLCFALGLSTIPGAFIPAAGTGNDGPPVPVLILDVLLGLISMVGVVVFWRTGNRLANRLAAGALIFNAVTALPAFFVDVDAWVKVLVAVVVLLTVVAVVLQLGRPKTTTVD